MGPKTENAGRITNSKPAEERQTEVIKDEPNTKETLAENKPIISKTDKEEKDLDDQVFKKSIEKSPILEEDIELKSDIVIIDLKHNEIDKSTENQHLKSETTVQVTDKDK